MNKMSERLLEKLIREDPARAAQTLRERPDELGPEKERLLECLLTAPASQSVQALAAEAVCQYELSPEQRLALLESLLRAELPKEAVSALTEAVIQSQPLKDQRAKLLKYLLTKPIPPETLPALTDVMAGMKLDKNQREKLLESLLAQPVPTENIPAMVSAMAEQKLDRAHRQKLLENLLAKPIPPETLPALTDVMAGMKLDKDQREKLLESLLSQPVPSETLPMLTDALLCGKPDKEQRGKLLEYLLSQPMGREQITEALRRLVGQMRFRALPEEELMAQRLCAYEETFALLEKWVDPERQAWKDGQAKALYRAVVEGEPLENVFLDMLCEGNICCLADAQIEFIDRKQLWLMFQELLFEEEYYCRFDTEEPYILDGGVNIGLAIYYAKHRYPKARIVGFEPWSVAYECAMRNVARNGWEKVTIHHAALGPKESVMQLVSMMENSLASTLTNRMDDYIEDRHIHKLVEDVDVVPLSRYMDGPVDLLKLDIEGMEAQVLRECGEKLRQVRGLFCEYHFGPELEDNSLAEILSLLEKAGFDFEVGKSAAYSALTKRRPFMNVGKIVSELIWAKRKE